LASLESGLLAAAFDKCTSFEETGVMVDQLADDFPALAGLSERLRIRMREELEDE
jgi:hypothetical protein